MSAYTDPDDDTSLHRLEGSGVQKGGLVIMKKGPSQDGESPHVFKRPDLPRVSMLGLDKLAAAKKKMVDDEKNEMKKSRVHSYRDGDEENELDENMERSHSHGDHRKR